MPRAGISSIVASWFISPICSGIIVFILFGLLRTFVLRSPHSFTRAFYVRPSPLCSNSLKPLVRALWMLPQMGYCSPWWHLMSALSLQALVGAPFRQGCL